MVRQQTAMALASPLHAHLDVVGEPLIGVHTSTALSEIFVPRRLPAGRGLLQIGRSDQASRPRLVVGSQDGVTLQAVIEGVAGISGPAVLHGHLSLRRESGV
jgi:hypothetical protein